MLRDFAVRSVNSRPRSLGSQMNTALEYIIFYSDVEVFERFNLTLGIFGTHLIKDWS